MQLFFVKILHIEESNPIKVITISGPEKTLCVALVPNVEASSGNQDFCTTTDPPKEGTD